MLAKQYTIKLPADYDMAIVRQRVADRGHLFDDWPGLAFKAFLISERVQGATANRYAPFYLWRDTSGTNEFLYGDGFAALEGSFGRPLIEHWLGLELRGSDLRAGPTPRSATREDVTVLDHEELAGVRRRELEWLEGCESSSNGLHAAVVALDPYRWQLVRFAMWRVAPEELDLRSAATRYEILHLSVPDAASADGGGGGGGA
jgi:hypothetical protein